MAAHRDLLALLLVWEIGKPWRLACADVDRALDGVRWYVEEIERQLARTAGATPLPGPVSNIASWNYPMSVQVHAELVQALAGNARGREDAEPGRVPLPDPGARVHGARGPAGDAAVRASGAKLGDALISSDGIGALAFVGGRSNGRAAATTLADTRTRHFLEQEGLNAWGIWDFTQWDAARPAPAQGLRVRQAAVHRLPALRRAAPAAPGVPGDLPAGASQDLRFGHPLAVAEPAATRCPTSTSDR